MTDLLDKLNEEQIDTVTSTEGYIRVIAGAGSGKTRALTHRFAYLVEAMGVLPSHILAVTFTNKSANVMRRRIHELTGDNDTGYINTFHGFCVSILQEDSHAVRYPKSFLVLDNTDIDTMLKTIYEERNLSLRDMTFSNARDMIEIRKTITNPDYYKDMIAMTAGELKTKYDNATLPKDIIFYGYLYQEKKCFALDYNDLIVFSLYIFDTVPEICKKWQKRLEYIMIDEFQDIDPLQYRLMEVLQGYHHNLFIVGDPDQTIYTWRGASVRHIIDFDQKHSPCKTIVMDKNYRSTPQIVSVVNSLISKNTERTEKSLKAQKPKGPKPVYYQAATAEKEAKWITQKIKALSSASIPLKDITILYRAHYVTRAIEDELLAAEIPYTIYSGVQFYDRMEIKDALSYLRLVAYKDDLSFLRVANTPKRNIGNRRIAFLKEYAEQNNCTLYDALLRTIDHEIFHGTKAKDLLKLIEKHSSSSAQKQVSELLREILDESGYEIMLRTQGSQTRLDNLSELRQSIYDYETTCGEECTLDHYLKHVSLFTGHDADGDEAPSKVKLMTVHTAKGLEFPYVFLASMNEGIFPSKKTDSKSGMEEERRLAFVAMTRAEKGLFISSSGGRNFDGNSRYPSRFLLEIDENLYDSILPISDDTKRELKKQIARDRHIKELACQTDSEQFTVSDRIRHPILGEGQIISLTDEGYEIRFDRIATPRIVSKRVALIKL